MLYIVFSIALFFVYILLMLLYRIGWSGQQSFIPSDIFSPAKKISVVIPARNESGNIAACLQSIIANDYPADLIEIIVADDFSTDDTDNIAGALLKKHNAGFVIKLSDHISPEERLNSYKKKALELAIGKASGQLIVTTDADCIVPQKWLYNIMAIAEMRQASFIAAPVNFVPVPGAEKHSVLYLFQSLDFMTMQGITAAANRLKLGNMCNGANLAFKKEAFTAVGGYKDIDHIASGDDMLLMYKIQRYQQGGVVYLKSKDAVVATPIQPSWRSFLNQRIRWSSKADKYDDKKLTWILAIVYFFNLNFLPLLISGIFDMEFLILAGYLLIGKVAAELFFLYPVSRFYGKQKELINFPLLQPLHILYVISAGFLGKFGSYHWKGRVVK